MPKRTHQPRKKKRKSNHGFRSRMASPGGKKTIKRRRVKGRKKITA